MTREEFFNTYFTGQKELSVMAAMGPSERGQFLSHVLGYERLRAAQDILREKRRSIVSELAGLRQGMSDPDAVMRQHSPRRNGGWPIRASVRACRAPATRRRPLA